MKSVSNKYRVRYIAWLLLVFVWGASLVMFVRRGGEVESFLLIVLGIAALQGIVLPRMVLAQITVSRSYKRSLQAPNYVAVELTVKWRRGLPFVWFSVEDWLENHSSTTAADSHRSRCSWRSGFRQEAVLIYELPALSRGVYEWGELKLSVGDMLGLTMVERVIPLKGGFVVEPVAPKLLREPRLLSLEGRVSSLSQTEEQGSYYQGAEGASGEQWTSNAPLLSGGYDELRPYREGDSLRHVDWRVAARGLEWATRVQEPASAARQVLVLDNSLASYERSDRLFDLATSSLLLLGKRALTYGESVLLVHSQEEQIIQNQYWGASDLSKLSHALAAVRMQEQSSGLQQQIKHLGQAFGVLHVVTADWKNTYWKKVAGQLRATGCRLVLLIVSRSHVPSFAMREQHRLLEASGIQLQWIMQIPTSRSLAAVNTQAVEQRYDLAAGGIGGNTYGG